MTAAAAIHLDVRRDLLAVVGKLIEPGTRCALVDFPRHANVGDSAIWLGERALLTELGADVVYVADLHTFSEADLSERLPTGTILLHGGGNLGDLWPHHQKLREQIIRAFPRHRIIQLPQSVHFGDPAGLDRAREVFDAHPDLLLLLRDHRSLLAARRAFRAPTMLCPDSALALSELPRSTRPSHRILWLSRTDHEAAHHTEPDLAADVHRSDWTGQQGADHAWIAALQTARRDLQAASMDRCRGVTSRPRDDLTRSYDRHAALHLLRGCRLLTSAQAVVTDRLHAHLLCLLLGLPHVVLNDRHGKVQSYWETWRHDRWWPVARLAPTPGHAIQQAQLLADPAPTRPAARRQA
ncbi:MAG: polysaccharide pyruvyl transferase family protein [Pseudonocardiales bacterium]|nr:polysaccharide pyruvyl transferase family protein [Pseudonocardiales bacterium]